MAQVRKGVGTALKMITRIKDQKQKDKKKLCGKDKDMDGIALQQNKRTKGPKDLKTTGKRKNKTIMVRIMEGLKAVKAK